jgi:AcrR family transcriptional regulator
MSSALPVSPTQRFQEKREAILNAAARLFNHDGVKGATLADIAASVGLVTNSVTYYYRKKEDLAAACFMRSIEAFQRVADVALAQPHIEARVQTFFGELARLVAAVEHGEHPVLIYFHDLRSLPPPHLEVVTAQYANLFRKVRALLKGPQTQGLSAADFNARAYGVLSLAHWLRSWIDRYDAAEYPDVARRTTDILLHGSLSERSQWVDATEAERSWQLRPVSDPTREAFLQAASRLINVQGYHGASVERIASMLNVTKGSFYHHHETKEDVAWACFERGFDVANRALDLALQTFDNGWQRATAALRALARFQLSPEGPLLRLAAITAVADRERRAEAIKLMNRLSMRQSNIVIDGMVDGSMRPLDPNVAGFMGTGVVSSASVLHHWVAEVNSDNVCRLFVRPMCTGLLCPPSGVA